MGLCAEITVPGVSDVTSGIGRRLGEHATALVGGAAKVAECMSPSWAKMPEGKPLSGRASTDGVTSPSEAKTPIMTKADVDRRNARFLEDQQFHRSASWLNSPYGQ